MKENIHIKEYPNGARVLYEHVPTAKYSAFTMHVAVGANAERPGEEGIAHCIEHMFFKGSEKRSAVELSEQMEALGAYINARTGSDATRYYFKCLTECFDRASEIYGDVLCHPAFPEDEFVQEKNVIVQEIAMRTDDPDQFVFDAAHEAMMSQTIANAHKVSGEKDQVLSLTTDKLRDFIARHYHGKNIILSVVSDLPFEEIVRIMERDFGDYLFAPARETAEELALPVTPKETTIALDKDWKQVKLFMMISTFSTLSERRFIARIYNRIVGYGQSSRLHVKVREEAGLAYTVYSSAYLFNQFGYVNIFAGISPENLKLCCEKIDEVLHEVAENGVTQEELDKAKIGIKTSFAFSASLLDESEDNAVALHLRGEILSDEEIMEKINAVTLEDVKAYAEELYREKVVTIAAGGTGVNEEILNNLKNHTHA